MQLTGAVATRLLLLADTHVPRRARDLPAAVWQAVEAADVVILRGGLDRVVRAIDLARESITAVRQTMRVAARANLGVVGLASFGFARPAATILLAHGTTIGAAALTAARPHFWRGKNTAHA